MLLRDLVMRRTALVFALLSFVVACASESRGRDDSSGSGGVNCPGVGNLTVDKVSPLGGTETCVIRAGSLTQTATITSGVNWEISGAIEVSNEATLVILAGATVTAADADTYLLMESGTTLQANGTAAAPIVFSSTDDGEDGSGEWGGIVVESYMASTTQHRLSYFVIAEAGAPISGILSGSDIEANLALIGQHEDTRIEFFQSHSSGGDGIVLLSEDADEVNNTLLESILVTSPTNDGVYFDNYSGLLKNLLVINDSATGRAGIRAGGVNSNPLIINVSLIGNDMTALPGGLEVPMLFDNGFESLQLANSLFYNYSGNCYNVQGGADLSSVANNDDGGIVDLGGDTVFVDGIHCADSFASVAGSNLPVAGSPNLLSALQGLLPTQEGVSSYTLAMVEFENATETAGWFLASINGNDNGTNQLRRLNGGDTNADGSIDSDDESFGPLFGRDELLYVGLNSLEEEAENNFGCRAPSTLPDGYIYYEDNAATIQQNPQPTGNTLSCGYIFIPATFGGFNLTVIGAVESASDDRFDDWTLEGTI